MCVCVCVCVCVDWQACENSNVYIVLFKMLMQFWSNKYWCNSEVTNTCWWLCMPNIIMSDDWPACEKSNVYIYIVLFKMLMQFWSNKCWCNWEVTDAYWWLCMPHIIIMFNGWQACENGRGAVLLSVARGKVSEGIDFGELSMNI